MLQKNEKQRLQGDRSTSKAAPAAASNAKKRAPAPADKVPEPRPKVAVIELKPEMLLHLLRDLTKAAVAGRSTDPGHAAPPASSPLKDHCEDAKQPPPSPLAIAYERLVCAQAKTAELISRITDRFASVLAQVPEDTQDANGCAVAHEGSSRLVSMIHHAAGTAELATARLVHLLNRCELPED